MVLPDSYVLSAWQSEENASDVTRVASTVVFPGFPPPSSPGSGPHYSDYSTPVGQADFDAVGMQDYPSAFLTSNFLFNSNTSDTTSTPPDLSQGCIPQISSSLEFALGPMLDGNPVTNNVPQTSVQTLPFFPGTEDGFRITASPDASPLADIPPLDWDIYQPEARSSYENSFTFNPEDPAVRIDSSSYPGQNQVVDLDAAQSPRYTAGLPFGRQLFLSRGFGHPQVCKWKEGDGPVCGELITHASLPGHLAEHGIKNIARDHSTTCHWVGCKRKKPMNRESITRHVREVHMRVKRPSKEMRNLCLSGGTGLSSKLYDHQAWYL